jgi:hypothetical protein
LAYAARQHAELKHRVYSHGVTTKATVTYWYAEAFPPDPNGIPHGTDNFIFRYSDANGRTLTQELSISAPGAPFREAWAPFIDNVALGGYIRRQGSDVREGELTAKQSPGIAIRYLPEDASSFVAIDFPPPTASSKTVLLGVLLLVSLVPGLTVFLWVPFYYLGLRWLRWLIGDKVVSTGEPT